MDEIEAAKGMIHLYPAKHVHAAPGAGKAMKRHCRIDDLKLLPIGGDLDLVARRDRHHGEGRAFGLPATGAAADMVEGRVGGDGDLYRVRHAVAVQLTAGEVWPTRLYAAVN